MRGRSGMENDMDAELRFHLEAYAADLRTSGLTEEEAYRKARLAFGNIEAHKQDVRQSRGLRFWDDLRADLTYTLRTLRKNPGFATIAILSLALGIGANTTIFTLANTILFDKLGVPHPDGLRLLSWTADDDKGVVHSMWGSYGPAHNHGFSSTSFSYPVYLALRTQSAGVADLFAFKPLEGNRRLTATIDGAAEVVTAELVSGNYYSVLNVKPQIGRLIANADDARAGSGPVIVISDRYWSSRFGRSHDVVGKQIALNRIPVTVIGVTPSGFTGASSVQVASDVFLPFSMQPMVAPFGRASLLEDKELWWTLVMGRLKPGVTEEQARAVIDLHLHQAVRSTMKIPAGGDVPRASLERGSQGENFAGKDQGQSVRILMGLVAFVLLLGCVNIANLLLARSATRKREISVRLALGAGRFRIIRQVLTESLLLSALGGIAGMLLGYWTRNFIPHFLSKAWDTTGIQAHFNWRVLLFSSGVSLAAGVLFGLAPAFNSARNDLNTGVKDRGIRTSQGRKSRAGQLLVILQISLSMILVTAAGLFLRTIINLAKADVGFDSSNLLLFQVQPPESRYAGAKSQRLLHEIEERVRIVPGVEGVAISSESLIAHGISNELFFIPGQPFARGEEHSSNINDVNADFFATMRIPILAGRTFNQTDAPTKNLVVVMNQAGAKKFFPGQNPLRRQLEKYDDGPVRVTIIGICKDAKYDDLRQQPPPTIYGFYRQSQEPMQMTFEVRSRELPQQLTPALRNAVRSVDKDLPLVDVRTQREQIDATTAEQRLFAALATGFGILALAIASVGVYGLMAFSVASRRNEIGIRMALGAQARQVLRMILRETGVLAIAGVAVGAAASLGCAKLLRSMLFGLTPNDPLTLGLSVAILLGAALLAGFLPARRAARIDPLEAVRHD
ncbi:MAG TPA: ABC transporter permease [Bryobacteraceae bacterium]|jgi:predicted permease|nr:ABC transporter permease [Bryobacteraceae bacterium]